VEFLKRHPLCVAYLANASVVAESVIDHVMAHNGDKSTFWDRENWQTLCALCHGKIETVLGRRWYLCEI
jgi:5-methylcytosine-specific restriction enzyme A